MEILLIILILFFVVPATAMAILLVLCMKILKKMDDAGSEPRIIFTGDPTQSGIVIISSEPDKNT